MKPSKIFLLYVVSLVFTPVSAQVVEARKNTIFAEGGGSALGYSLNFERRFKEFDKTAISWRAGAGASWNQGLALPVAIQLFSKRSKGSFEASAGLSYVYGALSVREAAGRVYSSGVYLTPALGYRYQGTKGFFFRATAYGLYKVVEFTENDFLEAARFGASVGLSFGYSFR